MKRTEGFYWVMDGHGNDEITIAYWQASPTWPGWVFSGCDMGPIDDDSIVQLSDRLECSIINKERPCEP